MTLVEFYHYGDCGPLDDHNPFKLFDELYVNEILYHIGKSKPYSLGASDISMLLDVDVKAVTVLINKLHALELIKDLEGKYAVNFTMIYEKDLEAIDHFSKTMADDISKAIVNQKESIYDLANGLRSTSDFDVDELLYHIIGSHILDGLAIDTLSKKGFFRTSKEQKGDRDYILFGFEKSKQVDQFSENILCSCNNCRTELLSFVSFGDAAGNRNDFYRFNRQVSSHINKLVAREETKTSYIKLLEKSNDKLVEACSCIVKKIIDRNNVFTVFTEEDERHAKHLKSFGYLEEYLGSYRVCVPVFYKDDNRIIRELHDVLIDIMLPVLEDNFNRAEDDLHISALEHGVDIKEVLNEMWHQVFGNVNESLVKLGVIKQPPYYEGEGRYLKAIYRNE